MANWIIHTDVTKSFGFLALLTDGSLLINEVNSKKWWKLTPDATGSYRTGTYSAIADSNHWQTFLAPCVQADGTLLLAGGEFSGNVNGVSSDPASKYTQRYDPVTNTWSGDLGAPTGWAAISDASCSLLPDNRFFIGYVQQIIGSGNEYAVLEGDSWTVLYSPGLAVVSDESVIGLLQDGTLLCVPATSAPATFKYIPSTSTWITAGNSPAIIGGAEAPPMVVLPDGRALVTNSNQTGASALYTPGVLPTDPGSWASAASMGVDGSGASWYQDDLPNVLLPSGQVLARVKSTTPSIAYLLYDPTGNTWTPTFTPVNDSTAIGSGSVRMIALPNGQIAQTTGGTSIAFYTPDGAPSPAWKPTITGFPEVMHPGDTYTIYGTQFNGLSQTAAPGDDGTIATNYPLVRSTDLDTGDIAYWRTQDHSTMGIATGSAIVSTRVTVPATASGRFSLAVVANGIASDLVTVVVERPIVQVVRGTASALFRIGVNQQSSPQFSNDGVSAIGAYAADGVTRATVSGADPVGPNDFTTRQYVTLQHVLREGNSTGGRDIILTTGDAIRGTPGFAGGPVTLAGGYATEGAGGDVFITGSDGVSLSAAFRGGNVTIVGGKSTAGGHAGNIVITGGQAVTGTNAGTVTITGGAGGSFSGAAGAVTVQGGTPIDGNGAAVTVRGSAGVGTNRAGGALSLLAGDSTGSGTPGVITGTAGAGGASRTGGSITFTAGAGGTASGAGGNFIARGGTANAAALTLSAGSIQLNGSASDGTGGTASLNGGNGNGSTSGGAAFIVSGAGGATGAGGTTLVTGGAGGSTSGNAGGVTITGGLPVDGNGGGVTIAGQSAATLTAASRNGGGVTITGGAATVAGTAGSISLTAGQSASGPAGTISITAGAGGTTSGNGGTVTVTGGAGTAANAAGGAITFTGGAGQGSGQGGIASLVGGPGGATGTGAFTLVTGGAGGATSGAAGGVTITGGTPVDGNGGPVTITGSAGVGTNRNGGGVTLQPGAKTGVGADGTIVLKDAIGTAQLSISTAGVTVDQIATAGIVLVSAAGLLSQGLLQLWCWGASASNATGGLTFLNAAASASAQTGVVGNGEIVQGAAAFTVTRITISLSSAYATDSSTWEVYVDGVASGFKVTIGTGVTSGTATGSLAIAAGKRVSIGCTQTGTENVAVKPRCSVWGYPA